MITIAAALAALPLVPVLPAAGGPSDVLTLHSEPAGCGPTDAANKLIATGRFASVDVFDVGSSTPSLAQLQAYDAVMVWSNQDFFDAIALGDVLADYVDGGGGVVVAAFANCSNNTNGNLQGRWTSGYQVMLGSGNVNGQAFQGQIVQPGHPTMTGFNNFNGGSSSFRPSSTALTSGSSMIARWSDGRSLVAEGANPKRIDLGFCPISSTCRSDLWQTNSQGALLMANALEHVGADPCSSGSSYCVSGTTANGCQATISASGLPSVSAGSGFVVSVSNMEGNKQGILFYGLSGPANGPWGIGGTSRLCVKAPTQRMGVQNSGGTTGACNGQMGVDWLTWTGSHPGKLGTPFGAGTTVWIQGWFRDPPSPKTTSLSNGWEFTTCP